MFDKILKDFKIYIKDYIKYLVDKSIIYSKSFIIVIILRLAFSISLDILTIIEDFLKSNPIAIFNISEYCVFPDFICHFIGWCILLAPTIIIFCSLILFEHLRDFYHLTHGRKILKFLLELIIPFGDRLIYKKIFIFFKERARTILHVLIFIYFITVPY